MSLSFSLRPWQKIEYHGTVAHYPFARVDPDRVDEFVERVRADLVGIGAGGRALTIDRGQRHVTIEVQANRRRSDISHSCETAVRGAAADLLGNAVTIAHFRRPTGPIRLPKGFPQ